MNYSVSWDDDALDTLATIWMHSADRRAVTAAQAAIDRLLVANPLGNGSPVSEGLWALEVHPLRVQFEIDVANRSVKVVSGGSYPESIPFSFAAAASFFEAEAIHRPATPAGPHGCRTA